jgi:hypothetical protein
MRARVTTLSGSLADVDTGVENFRANVVPFACEHGKGAILLVDRQNGEAIAITLWEGEDALRASDEAAHALRADAAAQMGRARRRPSHATRSPLSRSDFVDRPGRLDGEYDDGRAARPTPSMRLDR